jgi:hypothetical protein
MQSDSLIAIYLIIFHLGLRTACATAGTISILCLKFGRLLLLGCLASRHYYYSDERLIDRSGVYWSSRNDSDEIAFDTFREYGDFNRNLFLKRHRETDIFSKVLENGNNGANRANCTA